MKIQIPTVDPSPSDTALVAEGKNACNARNDCEGNDCINYDFPFEMRVKEKATGDRRQATGDGRRATADEGSR